MKINENKKWYLPWTWWDSDYIEKDVYGYVEYIDMSKINDAYISPIESNILTTIDEIRKYIEEEMESTIEIFKESKKSLDNLLARRLQSIRELTSKKSRNEEQKAQELEKVNEKLDLLKEFEETMQRIIEI